MLQIYKPNKNNTGSASSWSFNSKQESVFAQLIKQTSWIAEKHIGSFKGGAKMTVQFNLTEIGALLDVLNRQVEYGTFHRNGETSTSIKFYPYKRKDSDVIVGYGLSLKRGELSMAIGFTFAEAEVLKEFLKFALEHIFSAKYAESKKIAKEAQEKREQAEKPAEPTENNEIL
jgi:hypothetical protein